jgi:hypothetical protein
VRLYRARAEISERQVEISGGAAGQPWVSAPGTYVWSGRASQEGSSERILRSCTNVSGLELELFLLRTIMDIRARVRSHKGECLDGPNVPSGFGCAGKTVSPSLPFPLADLRRENGLAVDHVTLLIWSRSFVRSGGPFLRPDLPALRLRRAQASSRLVPSGPPLGLMALTMPSTVPGLGGLGRTGHLLAHLKVSTVVQDTPGDARELVG